MKMRKFYNCNGLYIVKINKTKNLNKKKIHEPILQDLIIYIKFI